MIAAKCPRCKGELTPNPCGNCSAPASMIEIYRSGVQLVRCGQCKVPVLRIQCAGCDTEISHDLFFQKGLVAGDFIVYVMPAAGLIGLTWFLSQITQSNAIIYFPVGIAVGILCLLKRKISPK